jgi:hypothetical protein
MTRLLLTTLLLLPLAAPAQIYKTTDEQGNVTYTDQPPADGSSSEKVELGTLNTTPPPPAAPKPAPRAVQEQDEAEPYSVTIVAPENETSLPMGPGDFSVNAMLEPPLGENDLVQLYMDGTPAGEPQRLLTWNLTSVLHGAHDLKVVVVDASGKQLAASEPVRIYVNRPYVSHRNRPAPAPR